MQFIIASCVYKNKSFDYINASSVFINKGCIYKNRTCIYSLYQTKKKFGIRGKELCL